MVPQTQLLMSLLLYISGETLKMAQSLQNNIFVETKIVTCTWI
jgi:hypothetical protein